ncbi:uncharacterized protein LOC126375293 [Pectinophora gossypiella]|nr:uncharacterized protein LOC126375293 [Pectinophora gossypiella]
MSAVMITHYTSKRNIAYKRLSDAVALARRFALTESNAAPENIKEQEKYQEEADDMYFEVLEIMKKHLHKKEQSDIKPSIDTSKHQNLKLPPMKLPTFLGQLKDFPGFIDLYNTLVHHRKDLSNVEKFQYLITSLSGEPINIIRAFPISEANYQHAYDALVDRCKTCNQRHNSLLHFPVKQNQKTASNQQSAPSPPSSENVITPVTSLSNISNSSDSSFVLLATAEVEVKDGFGAYQRVRVLLDPGSQSHIITSSCARRLGLTKYKTNTPMSGIGEAPAQSSGRVFLEIRPIGKSEPSFVTEALTLDKICGDMPTHHVNQNNFKHVVNLKLADERYHQSRAVDILMGGELFPQILLPGKVEGENQGATAINTIFGYVLMGRTPTSSSDSIPTPLSVNHVSIDANLDVAVQKLWEMDNISSEPKCQSADDIRCEQIYQSTTRRDSEGRYVVQLPFRDQLPVFEDSYSNAYRRFQQIEKKLIQNLAFQKQYNEHILEYLSSSQMEVVPPEECRSPKAYYIPHFAVVKPGQLRVVYDASAKDKVGISLNDTLLTGPKLQAEITDILWRFRLHNIVFTTDIRQMYRRIIVTDKHRDYQRILFRSNPDEPVQEYRLNRVTFGVSSAPFLAIRTIQQLAQDEEESFPVAAQILRQDLYVDDVVTGCSTVEQALERQQQLIGIMGSGGFELRKWSSNHTAVLQSIPENHRAVPGVTFDSDSNFVKVLGLAWNSQNDTFEYQVNQIKRDCTKRTMLSELARIYDPIGLLTPLTFMAKHLIQRLWLLGTSWDEAVPGEIHQIWMKYTEQLPHLSQLRIPRRITKNDTVTYQLHGFSDASEAGYAGVVYLRSTDERNQHHVALVGARSRVAPTKRRTLPRLELCGATLLAELMMHIKNLYADMITIEGVWAWCDSTIVLSWINSNSTDYKAFVGNRISIIQRKIPDAKWMHVSGKQNPADCASRGLTPDELINHNSWWTGPEWLSHDQHHWPIEPDTTKSPPIDPEISCERPSKLHREQVIRGAPQEQHSSQVQSLITPRYSTFQLVSIDIVFQSPEKMLNVKEGVMERNNMQESEL